MLPLDLLGKVFAGPSPEQPEERPAEAIMPLLSIDIGCGAKKRSGYLGVDKLPLPGVDHTSDFASEPLPFADNTVGQVFSSHCLEHLIDPTTLLRELTRVCVHGARIEFWAPYSWYGDAHFFDHVSFFNERQFLHVGVCHHEHWSKLLGGSWVIHRVTYSIFDHVLRDLRANRVDVGFALRYYKDVANEMGLVFQIDKQNILPHRMPQVSYAKGRDQRRHPLAGATQARALRLLGRMASDLMSRLAP